MKKNAKANGRKDHVIHSGAAASRGGKGNEIHTAAKEEKEKSEAKQGRASFITGSTTQGGSNHGQGSMHLGGESYKQGDTKNSGANYDDEKDRLGSLKDYGRSTSSDKKSEARTDYPGPTKKTLDKEHKKGADSKKH